MGTIKLKTNDSFDPQKIFSLKKQSKNGILSFKNRQNQTITFDALTSKTLGDAPFALSATSSSNLPVTFLTEDIDKININNNIVTILKVGTAQISANQYGDINYKEASSIRRSLLINKINQTITFSALASKNCLDPAFALTATSNSGLTVSYASSNTSVATVAGSTVTIITGGTTTITASQNGNENYSAATSVNQLLTVNKINQTITFAAIPTKNQSDGPFALTATSSSGLTVSYASSNTSVATVAGSTVTIVGAGTSTITASQAGDSCYNAATSVNQTLTVNSSKPVVTNPGTLQYYSTQPFSRTLTATNSPTSWSATGLPSGATLNSSGVLSGTVSAAGNYTINVTATNAYGTSSPISFTLSIVTVAQAGLAVATNDHFFAYANTAGTNGCTACYPNAGCQNTANAPFYTTYVSTNLYRRWYSSAGALTPANVCSTTFTSNICKVNAQIYRIGTQNPMGLGDFFVWCWMHNRTLYMNITAGTYPTYRTSSPVNLFCGSRIGSFISFVAI
jgi:hypothetical protein